MTDLVHTLQKALIKAAALLFALIPALSNAQAIYDASGQYKGYSQTSPSGVTTNYNTQGQNVGSSQIDNGQTNYYSPQGQHQGTNTATPAPLQSNTTINTPRQAPQAPSVKGW
jgi:hypothetical protein